MMLWAPLKPRTPRHFYYPTEALRFREAAAIRRLRNPAI